MDKKRILITGAKGQLGSDLVKVFSEAGYEVFGFGREQLDIVNDESVREVFLKTRPDIVIHSAAYTKVDLAESEPDLAYLINSIGTRNIAVSANEINAKLVYISTDYVFNGEASIPYNEFSPTSPLGIYGKSKLAGEDFVRSFHQKFFIVRTSWVYGKSGNNFVKTMINLARIKDSISVVNDQKGCPTYTVDLANCILNMINTQKYGIYHVSNSGSCTWYEFAVEIFKHLNQEVKVIPISSSEFIRPAARPSFSVFDHLALRLHNFPEMRNWRIALKDLLNDDFVKSVTLPVKKQESTNE
jgi:dTDP-4-dehydrorhamnose reductase